MSSAVLIQQATGVCLPMLELVAGRHAAYCARHGITYWPVLGNVQFSRATHWNKIVLIQQALEMGFETVAWLDADTLIVRPEHDLRGTFAGHAPLALAEHPNPGLNGAPTHWNTGVMFMRNTPRTREFFKTVWEAGPLGKHYWHEQARMLDLIPQFPGLIQRLDDRWNSTETLTDVPEPIIKAWHGAGRAALTSIYQELRNLGAVDARVAAVATGFVHYDNCIQRAAGFINSIAPYPGGFEGRGIVICGGADYFTSVWVCVHQLRRLGCTLPIELWYLGAREMDEHMRGLLAPLGVEFVDARALRKKRPVRILGGWEMKPYALLHSRFREVLLLDADNVPVLDPEFLFDTPQFRDTGAIFWPDYNRMEPGRSAWTVFDVPYRDEPEFESGQIVLDKQRCWRPLNLTLWYNEHSDFFYHHVWGDKDTFRFAWHKLGRRFAMTSSPLHALENTMCQHDFEGRRVFQHRNTDKWNLHKENKRVAGFLFEEECRADVARLRTLWDGKVQRPATPFPADAPPPRLPVPVQG